jgi:uncharacterized protein
MRVHASDFFGVEVGREGFSPKQAPIDKELDMREVVIRELWTYPIKGCQGIEAQEIDVRKRGIPGDRSFVLWREGKLVDQIETPKLASIGARYDDESGRLTLLQEGNESFVHTVQTEGEARKAQWVLDEFETIDQGDEVAAWFSAALDKDVRLVTPGRSWRINFPIPQLKRVHNQEKQSFFSASPVSLANIASLDELNRQLERPVPMDRFRMNIIVDGLTPYEEDTLESLSNSEVSLLQVTPAERCVIVTTDQKTGERLKSDLLKKLPKKPKSESFGSSRTFGSYMTVAKSGKLRVGDRLRLA